MPSSSAAATTVSSAPPISRAPVRTSACSSAAAILGGAAVTEEFHPGFRNSTASYTVSLLNPKIIRDLSLAAHGLAIIPRPLANFLPLPTQTAAAISRSAAASRRRRRKSRNSRRATRSGCRRITRCSSAWPTFCATFCWSTPPNVGGGIHALLDAWKVAKRFRTLDLAGQRDVLDLFTKSAGDLLDGWFESAPIKAAFGFDAVVGNFASPYTPGSAYVLLHHVFGEVNGQRGQWGHARGGMGAITQAMARECAARGVTLRTDAAVARVVVKGARAVGVELEGGEVVEAARVVANVNPKLLFERLVAPEHLDADFRARIAAYRCGSGTFRMNVALSELPDFTALPGTTPAPHHASGIILAPSLAYMERAYFDARTHGLVARADRRSADPVGGRRYARAAGAARREPLLPARASGPAGGDAGPDVGRRARGGRRPDDRRR